MSFNKNSWFFYLRLIFALSIFTISLLNSITGFAVVNEESECITDKTHLMLIQLHNFFLQHRTTKLVVTFFLNLIFDAVILATFYNWVNYSKTYKLFVETVYFLAIKFVCCFLFTMRNPSSNIYERVWFPTLFTSYTRSNDFMVSGMTGMSVIAAKFFNSKISVFIYIFLILNIIFRLSLHSMYIIDAVTGLVTAFYVEIVYSKDFCRKFCRQFLTKRKF